MMALKRSTCFTDLKDGEGEQAGQREPEVCGAHAELLRHRAGQGTGSKGGRDGRYRNNDGRGDRVPPGLL